MLLPVTFLARPRAIRQLMASGTLHQVRELQATLRAGFVLDLGIPPPAASPVEWCNRIVRIGANELAEHEGRPHSEGLEHER